MRILLVVAVALGVILMLGRDRISLRTRPARLLAYLVAIPFAAIVAVNVMMGLESCDSAEYECDLAGLAYVFAGGTTVVLGIVAAVVLEIVLATRKVRS